MDRSFSPTIRPARRDEAAKLTQVGVRATSAYGYDPKTIELLRPVLVLDETLFDHGRIFVAAEEHRGVLGVMALVPTPFAGLVLLDRIFVDPAAQRQGLGRKLFLEAVAQAARLKASVVLIYAHPSAADFYERLGAMRIGKTPLSIMPALKLAMMSYAIQN